MHFFKKNKAKSVYMAVNLDMENAYDRLEWNFNKLVLTKLGFIPNGSVGLGNTFPWCISPF